jgi:alpha-tubulin suppressor-like RCC1 family protein
MDRNEDLTSAKMALLSRAGADPGDLLRAKRRQFVPVASELARQLMWSRCATAAASPRLVTPSSARIIRLSAGYSHLLALRSDGTVLAWGDNARNRLSGTAGCPQQDLVNRGGARA